MHIFASEQEIAKQIQSNTSIAYTSSIPDPLSEKMVWFGPHVQRVNHSGNFTEGELDVVNASIKDKELFYHTSILVSTNWNKNGDVFLPQVVWAAKDTPIHKPTNLEHDNNKIIGHMTNSWAIGTDNKLIANDTTDADLPSKFHILVGSVIYKFWPDNEQYAVSVGKLLEEISNGSKYVSMECRFDDFDYALASENNIKILTRNEQTSFLSKHLSAYGGTGEFKQFKIGRVVKNISFCGKGYVDKPANPESVIFTNNDVYDFANANFIEKNVFSDSLGVINSSDETNIQEPFIMSDYLQDQNKELKAKVESMAKEMESVKEQFTKSNVAQLEKTIENLTAKATDIGGDLKVKTDELTAESVKAKELQKKLDEIIKSNEDLVKANDEFKKQVEKVEAEKKTQDRVTTLVSAGLTKEDAEKEVSLFASLNDDQFKAVSERIIEAKKKLPPFIKDKKEKDDEAEDAADAALDEAKPSDEEVTSASADADKDDVVFSSLVSNLAKAMQTSDKNGEK